VRSKNVLADVLTNRCSVVPHFDLEQQPIGLKL